MALAAFFMSKKLKAQEEKVNKISKQFQQSCLQVESLMEDLDIGVIVYGKDGRLVMANKLVSQMLKLDEVPNHINIFLSQFGEANGLKASALLGNGYSEAQITVGTKTFELRMKDSGLEGHNRFATMIIVRDITTKLEEDKQRKDFVGNVSHELRTPLTIIRTYTESLLEWGIDEKKPQAIKQDLQRILEDTDRMEALIKDLLLLSSLDSKAKTMHMEEVDMVSQMRELVKRCQVQADEKGIELSLDVLTETDSVFADCVSLDRIFLNILQNALRYTDRAGKVQVFISMVADDVVVKIKDNGKGIDPKYQQAIFERFYRVDNTGSRKHGGTGLGLSIAKELVSLHHGKIQVRSVPTVGSEFTVTLPTLAKVCRKMMLDLVQGEDFDRDPFLSELEAYLLEQAKGLGIEKTALADLTRQEREVLMKPYKEEEHVDRKEDFAGVLEVDLDEIDESGTDEEPEDPVET